MRRTLVLIGILILLGVIRLIQVWMQSDVILAPPNPLASINQAAVTGITISTGTGDNETKAELVMETSLWKTVNPGDIADNSKVTSFLSELTTANVNRLASENMSNLTNYGLDDELATHIVLKSGESQVAKVKISQASGGKYFLIAEDSNQILEIKGNIDASSSIDNWRSRQILPIDTAAVTEIELRGRSSFVLGRNGEGIQYLSDNETKDVPADKYNAYLSAVNNLSASGFTDESAVSEPENSTLTLIVRTPDQPEQEIKIYANEEGEDYVVKTNQRSAYFLLPDPELTRIESPSLDNEAPPVADPNVDLPLDIQSGS